MIGRAQVASSNDATTAALGVVNYINSNSNLADALGGLIRLGFHDAAGQNGANGCLAAITEHNGLPAVVASLEAIRPSGMSKADLWALAAIVAVKQAGGPSMTFWSGRTDCTSAVCCDDTGLLPGADPASDVWQNVFDNLGARLGFSAQEITALMGAHSVGVAFEANSGFNGPWIPQNTVLSNSYYNRLANVGWARTTTASGARVWLDAGNRIMLQTDMVLILDPLSCSATRQVCTQNTVTFGYVQSYINNNTLFLNDFDLAYGKLLQAGWAAGSLTAVPFSTTVAPTPRPSPEPTTRNPTPAPTSKPTAEPTTPKPTPAPTTKEPTTAQPTVPTPSPTRQPTFQPTPEPSSKPTKVPTQKPSTRPTAAPSAPTVTPTSRRGR